MAENDRSDYLPLDRLLAEWRVGSGEWSWQEEHDLLWFDPVKADRTDELATKVHVEGIREPVLLGTDGRVWDGHHRIVVAMRLGIENIPVEYVGASPNASSRGDEATT